MIEALRQAGHEVLSAKESMRGAADVAVLQRARDEARLLLSHDKDFGELAFRSGLPAECGIILFRLGGTGPDSDRRRMLQAVASRQDWAGSFAVVTDDRIRIRPLPQGKR
jgi:predicted nuclease of predicted toxin-antitoxin system